MADRKHLLHVKSNVVEKTRQYGIDNFLVTPKKPVDLMYGEIAVNYGKGVEALTIKNSEDNVVAFVNENDFYEAGEITAAALATEKKEREEAEFVTADALNYLNDKIDTSAVSVMVSTTYDEIKSLRDQSKLKSGQFYRITDYVTTSTQENTRSAGHAFDVIVIATDVDTLNENAKAIKHEGDTYFADCNLDAWEIKYDLDNNTNKYAWADETNGKGVIFYMKDEWNNECPYDFKNIQFKRWAVTDVQDDKLDETTLDSLKATFVYNNVNTKFITRYAYQNSNCVYGSTTHVVNSNDSDWYYTFSTFKFENNIYALNEIEDASIKGNNFYNGEGDSGCLGNTIKPYYDNMASDHDGIDGVQYLNNIVFNGCYYETIERGYVYHCFANSIGYHSYNFTFGNDCHGNSSGENCVGNLFGNHCKGNSIGMKCSSNSFGDDCVGNSFGDDCGDNSFGNGCGDNSFGNGCQGNSFGNSCGSNSFDNGCSNNSFSNDCTNNSFGMMCNNNSFGNNCDSNTFGMSCDNNSFGDDCSSNSFGDDCVGNSFGDDCSSNSFENSCSNNSFGNNCDSNTFGESCSGNTFENDCGGNSFGNGCAYNSFGMNCGNNSFGDSCTNNSFENDCDNNSFGDSCVGNSFGENCSNNSFGENCSNNSFGNSCVGNSFGDSCVGNSFGNDCDNNSFENSCNNNSFENNCDSNTFGEYSGSNTFENDCNINSFGNNCDNNSFGNGCNNNSFENSCSNNSFENNCDSNTFGENCSGNSFGNKVGQVKFEKDYMQNNIIENGNTYITVTSTQTTSVSSTIRNFTIAQGVNNAASENQRKTISHNTTNDTFRTIYQNASSQTVNV